MLPCTNFVAFGSNIVYGIVCKDGIAYTMQARAA